jgi:integrase
MQSPEPFNILCPLCASKRVWHDGLRYTLEGNTQRFICRDCGHRFSERKPLQENSSWLINRANATVRGSRVCELQQESKNLTEVTRQETAQREGTTLNADVKGKIIEFLWYLEKQGKTKYTILNRKYTLQTLQKLGANLFDPESVKAAISKNTKWSLNSKPQIVQNYKSFAKFLKIEWEPPKYTPPENLPFIPLEKELETLIQGSGRNTGAFLRGLKDTGADPGELAGLKWVDINPQSKTVAINHPVKGHSARVLKVSDEFLTRINNIQKKDGEKVFASIAAITNNFANQRKRIAYTCGNPRLLKITLRTFRHWKGTIEYHKTHDVYHVKRLLGHKRLRSTEIYINLEQAVFTEQNDEFHVKAVSSLEEACKLLEVGFEYVTDFDGYKLFRKRK